MFERLRELEQRVRRWIRYTRLLTLNILGTCLFTCQHAGRLFCSLLHIPLDPFLTRGNGRNSCLQPMQESPNSTSTAVRAVSTAKAPWPRISTCLSCSLPFTGWRHATCRPACGGYVRVAANAEETLEIQRTPKSYAPKPSQLLTVLTFG